MFELWTRFCSYASERSFTTLVASRPSSAFLYRSIYWTALFAVGIIASFAALIYLTPGSKSGLMAFVIGLACARLTGRFYDRRSQR